ncbi:MAG TPA: DUF2079 domain-containing protein [Patescibacteria group bacterium]|nr:DUF2079 domain-containing protein [Patescibacteria group bacterium]
MKKFFSYPYFFPLFISFLFFIAYAALGVIKHNHFLSGYDLAVIDQAIWHYSHLQLPISTNHAYAFTPIYWDHVELIFPLFAPLYWIWSDVRALIILQAFVMCSSGFAVYLIAKKYAVKTVVASALLVSYLMFYGIQNALWSDVHSLVFGVGFLAWFLYFSLTKYNRWTWIFFFLTIFSKEDMALITAIISLLLFWKTKQKQYLFFLGISCVYLVFIFTIYFPFFIPGGYRFQNKSGLLSHLDATTLYNTSDKRDVLLYSSVWFGFLPFLSPLFLLPAFFDLVKYFVVANANVTSGQSLFGHYRSMLALLFVWPTIITIGRYKKLNNIYIACYLLLFALFIQYQLHLPLSYFSKQWFWTKPASTNTIEQMLTKIPPDASIATQINILPHLSHRKLEFVLWPDTKDFLINSPCGQKNCTWFRIADKPQYILVDTATDWDVRYWLTDRNTFIQGLQNMEKAGVITQKQTIDTTTLYVVIKKP